MPETPGSSGRVSSYVCPKCGNPNAFDQHEQHCPGEPPGRVQSCEHDGCFRPASAPFWRYCCDACHDADGDGLPPEHEYGCRRVITPARNAR